MMNSIITICTLLSVSVSGRHFYTLPKSSPLNTTSEKLDLTGEFAKIALRDMHESDDHFLQESASQLDQYFDLETIQIMFDHNLQFKEFVYIFEDLWNHAGLHFDRIERNV